LRVGLFMSGLLGGFLMVLFPRAFGAWMTIPLFVLAALGEIIGRVWFYRSRSQLF
jgi:uncharacterized membrane protein